MRREDRELAVYTSLKLGVFRFSKHEMATLKFLAEISHEEKVFLILILMFYDFQKTVEEPMVRIYYEAVFAALILNLVL